VSWPIGETTKEAGGMMKILHVVRQYDPAVGGMETYVNDMIVHQKRLECDCEVLTLNTVFQSDKGTLPSIEIINDIKIHRVKFFGKRTFFFPLIAPSFFKNYDVVHVHNTDIFFDYVGLVCRFLKIPAFATTHGGFFHTQNFSFIKKLYFNTITRFTGAHYKAIFASSLNDHQLFQGKNKNILLMPNAITPPGDYIVTGNDFVYIGRLAAHKNIDQLIDTFAVLVKKYNVNGNLHIIGPEWDVLRSDLNHKIETLGIADRVTIYGFVAQTEMDHILKQCGYFFSASSYEGFGMSMLEGMSVGLIPFVQPNGSFRDLINQGAIGFCVDYLHPDNAASTIAKKLNNITNNDRERARKFSLEFSWPKLAEKTVQAYQKY